MQPSTPPTPPTALPRPAHAKDTARLPWKVLGGKTPSVANVPALRQYCDGLGIPYAKGDKKKALLRLVQSWQAANPGPPTTTTVNLPKPTKHPKKKKAASSKKSSSPSSTPSSASPLASSSANLTTDGAGSSATLKFDPLDAAFNEETGEVDLEQVNAFPLEHGRDDDGFAAALQNGLNLEADPDEEEGEVEEEEEELPSEFLPVTQLELDRLMRIVPVEGDESSNTAMDAAVRLEMDQSRRKGAVNTEKSVLRPFWAWFRKKTNRGHHKDDIITNDVFLGYLKYSSERKLRGTNGKVKDSNAILSASSLKKIVTMLSRVRGAQRTYTLLLSGDDLDNTRPLAKPTIIKYLTHLRIRASTHARNIFARDVTEGTIFEYASVTPAKMEEMVKWIYKGQQGPTILNMAFFLTITTQTLMRMDDVLSVLLAFIQPWKYIISPTRELFCLVLMRYDGKLLSSKPTDEPAYHFIIPHKNPVLCAVLHLAGHLHRLFDEMEIQNQPHLTDGKTWDWSINSSWRMVRLLFGRKSALQPLSNSSIATQVGKNLEAQQIQSRNRGHLGRKMGAVTMEQLGADSHDIERVGLWSTSSFSSTYETKMSKIGVKTAAGFISDEEIVHPHLDVEVPSELLDPIFTFADEELRSGRFHDVGTTNTLNMFIQLRKFVVIYYATVYQHSPHSKIFGRDLFQGRNNPYITWFRDEYPTLLAEAKLRAVTVAKQFQRVDEPVIRDGFTTLYRQGEGMEEEMASCFATLKRRTEWMSPSKRVRVDESGGYTGYTPTPIPGHPLFPPGHYPFYYPYPYPPPSLSYDPYPSSQITTALPTPPPAFDISTSSSRPTRPLPPPRPIPMTARLAPPLLIGDSSPSAATPAASAPAQPQASASPPRLTGQDSLSPRHSPSPGLSSPVNRPPTSSSSAPSTPQPPTRQTGSSTSSPSASSSSTSVRGIAPPPVLSPHRARVTHYAPTPSDLILPVDLRAFSDPPPLMPPTFAKLDWATVLGAVTAPHYLYSTYKPLEPFGSSYKSVHEVWEHYSDGREGEAIGGVGRLPPIRKLEELFPGGRKGWWRDPSYQGLAAGTEKNTFSQHFSNFMAIPLRIEYIMKRDTCSADDAIAKLLALTKTPMDKVSLTASEAKKVLKLPSKR